MGNQEKQEKETEQIKETGSLELETKHGDYKVYLLTIIGEIEGHEAVSGSTKATKYEHLLPKLAEIESSDEIEEYHSAQYFRWRCGGRTCHCRDDRLVEQADRISCPWRKPFHWRAACCFFGLFVYCAERNYDCTPGTFQRDVYRGDRENSTREWSVHRIGLPSLFPVIHKLLKSVWKS